jgi:hypothetical protein
VRATEIGSPRRSGSGRNAGGGRDAVPSGSTENGMHKALKPCACRAISLSAVSKQQADKLKC